jgi:hypothetical protein
LAETSLSSGAPYRAPYFVSEVLYQLRELVGSAADLRGGLHVHTTLDLKLQVGSSPFFFPRYGSSVLRRVMKGGLVK